MAEKRKKQRGLLDIVPEAAPEAAAVSGGWLDPASYDPAMLSYRAGTGLRNMMAGTAALPGLLGEVGRGALQKIRELSPEDLRGRAAPQDTTVVDAASALARRVAQDPGAAASKVLDYGRGILSSPGNVVEFLGENITPRPRGPRPVMQEIDVYHGSPHRFEEFDASKIGTGEGAQAYGHGIYLAESPDVARDYQVRLSYDPDKMKIGGKQINEVYDQLQNSADRMPPARAAAEYEKLELIERLMMNNPVDEVGKAAAELSPATQRWFATQVKPNFETYGSFYTADLPDKIVDRMLDWDASIKSQPENIRNALQPLLEKHGIARTADIGTLISAMGRDMPQSMVSEKLRELGIPGIKYLDAGSRGQGGTGTRNFVVFPGEEKNVKILKRE